MSGQTYYAYVCQGDENDYYYFDISALTPITIDLTNIPDGADYDLFLYDPLKNVAEESRSPGNADERISHTPTITGRYYIRVWPYKGYNDTSPYALLVVYG
jgi:hypothetical protein